MGSGLSPNGMAFSSEGMLSTALLDNIIAVDTQKQQVTVQAGARVDQVCTTPLVGHLLVLLRYFWSSKLPYRI